MKFFTNCLLSSVILLNTTTLFAEVENRLKEIGRAFPGNAFANYQLPTANCDNLDQDLSYHLMMNPSTIEEGMKAARKTLENFGIGENLEGTSSSKVEAKGSDIVNTISSSHVLRLRGVGPKKSQPMGGPKHTGDTSDKEEGDKEEGEPDLKSEDTNIVTSSVNKDLQNQTINKVESKSLKKAVKDVSLFPSSSLSPLNAENTTSSSTQKNRQSLALEDIRKAVKDNPDTVRFIIKEDKKEGTVSIQADQALDNNPKKINQENKTIIKELLTTFSKLHPPEKVVISLVSKLDELKEGPSLIEAMIPKILDSFDDECRKIDKVMSEWFKINEKEEKYPSLTSAIMQEILEVFDEECDKIDRTIDFFS